MHMGRKTFLKSDPDFIVCVTISRTMLTAAFLLPPLQLIVINRFSLHSDFKVPKPKAKHFKDTVALCWGIRFLFVVVVVLFSFLFFFLNN